MKKEVLAKRLSPKLKKLLKSSTFYEKARRHFHHGIINRHEFLRGFMKGNAWLFSQPKSGTNLICSTVAFYNAERMGISSYSFGDRYRLGLVHGSRVNSQTIEEFNDFRLKSNMPVFVRTHDDIPGAEPKYLVNITRNVLDNLVSAYHFTWQPRGYSVDDSLRPMIAEFASIHRAQKEAAERAEHSVLLRYERLKEMPVDAFTQLFDLVFGETDQAALSTALEAASPDRFKEWEKKVGAFIPDATKKFQKSFIRSGKIGEGATFFTEIQIREISALLDVAGIMQDKDVVL